MERYLSTIVINNHMLLILSIKCIKVNERSPGSDTIKSRSQPMTPRGREKKDSKQCIREPNRTTLSSPSEVNRTKKKTREQGTWQDEAAHEIMAFFVLRKLLFQTPMRSHLQGLYV